MNELMNVKNNVAFMGQSGLIKKTKDGYIQRVEVDVELSYRANHFWKLETKKKNSDNQWVTEAAYKLTAEGYEYLNKFAGLKVLNEPTFDLNGDIITNPAIILDSTNRKEAVYYKITLYGYGPDGTLHFSPVLIHYNASDELISSIITAIKYQNSNKMGHMCPKDAFPAFKKDHPYAIFVPTDEIGDMVLGIAVDVMHSDFLKLRGVHQEKINNLEKKIQTVAKRNAFRKHPATAVYSVNPHPKYDANNKFIDLVHIEKIVQWVDVDIEKEEVAIAEYIAEQNVEVTNFKDLEPDKEDVEDETVDETITEVNAVEEYIDVDIVEDDAEEINKRITWIKKGCKRLNQDVPVLDGLSIMELEAIITKIQKEEE